MNETGVTTVDGNCSVSVSLISTNEIQLVAMRDGRYVSTWFPASVAELIVAALQEHIAAAREMD